jgi:hypothetical protein
MIDVGHMTTHEAGDKFAELICADPQWLDQEFSALMAANFTARPRGHARLHHLRSHQAATTAAVRPASPHAPVTSGWRR